MSARGRGSRSGGRSSRTAAAAAPAAATPAALLEEAETLQQRAERKRGREALAAYEGAAAAFARAGAAAAGDEEATAAAAFGMGECLQMWADALLELAASLPDADLSEQAEAEAAASAAGLYDRAVAAYCSVTVSAPGAGAAVRADAAVNAANALCAAAGLAPVAAGGGAGAMLARAVELYRAALAQEEDALTLSNMADALVQQGEAAAAAGDGGLAQAAFAAALAAYDQSCGLSDSEAGDDLPSLLHNWGVGLHTIAKATQDPGARRPLLEQASQRLRHSLQFSRGDTAPANALGDVLMDAAELLAGGLLTDPSSGGGGGGGGSGVTASSEQIAAAAAAARGAAEEGYQAALTISRHNADALVGLAEANVALGRLAAAAAVGGDAGAGAAAAGHFQQAAAYYGQALQRPEQLGRLSDRRDTRYNAACALALAGDAAGALALLQALGAARVAAQNAGSSGGEGWLVAADMAADGDLVSLRGHPGFQELLQALAAAGA